MIQLRPYQVTAIESCLAQIDQRPVLCAPTGSGKTTMGVAIVSRVPGRVLWLAHRRELIEQAAQAIYAAGGDPGLILPGETPRPWKRVQVGSVQTIARRGYSEVDLLVIDECHHAAAGSYAALQAPRMLGLTATPFRLDGAGLRPPFGALVVASTPAELCRQGYLVQPEVYAPPAPDLSGIRTRAGDFELGKLGERMSSRALVGNVVRNWQRVGAGRPTVVFAVNIAHSKVLVERFRAEGITAEHIDAGTPAHERAAALRRWRAGETAVVSNCTLVTEGFDFPGLEVAVIARPTKSLCLHMQMIGRVMRGCEDKSGATVLDHAGNHDRLGMVTQTLEYSLDGLKREPRESLPGIGRCPKCYMLLDAGWTICPACGATRPAPEIPTETDDMLVPTGEGIPFEVQQDYWNTLRAAVETRGYKQGWALYRFKERFGAWPVVADGELVDPRLPTETQKENVLRELMVQGKERGYKPGWAAYQFKERFGVWPGWGMKSRVTAEVYAGAAI